MYQSKDIPFRVILSIILLFCFTAMSSTVNAEKLDSEDENETQDQIEDLRELLKVKPLVIPNLDGTLKLDGVLDESLWDEASSYEIELETYPARLDPSPVRTVVKIGRMGDDFIVGFIAYDPEPDKIQAPLRDRDGIELDDYVGLSIDPTGRLLKTYEFFVSARGVFPNAATADGATGSETCANRPAWLI